MARASALHFTGPPFTASLSTLPSQLLSVLQAAEAFIYLAMILSSKYLSHLPLTHMILFSSRSSPAPLSLLGGTGKAESEERVSTGATILLWGSVVRWVHTTQSSTSTTLSFSIFTKSFASEQHQVETAPSLSMKPNCTKHKQNIFFLNPK